MVDRIISGGLVSKSGEPMLFVEPIAFCSLTVPQMAHSFSNENIVVPYADPTIETKRANATKETTDVKLFIS
jgi:hypothetical protein